MYEISMMCRCIRSECLFNLIEGTLFEGKISVAKNGQPTFIIYTGGKSEIHCLLDWFENYFELVK